MEKALPLGFQASTVEAKFRNKSRKDLGLIYSDRPCVLAALFTRNKFCAAPVLVDREILVKGNPVRAIVANSGQANACTGKKGMENCLEIQKLTAEYLHIKTDEVLLISTGVIGAQFDMEKWHKSLPELCQLSPLADAEGFTRAFMTTDAFPKFASREIELSNGRIRLTVMAKGAGMICPNMATMLCVVLTDALLQKAEWQGMFERAVNRTFNRVSVDGDTSTNDTILGLANGASGIAFANSKDEEMLEKALTDILAKVSYMLVQDGEGASKVIHISVKGAANDGEAKKVARAVAASQLVKTAIYGGDANWGRIINAAGYSGAEFNPEEVGLYLCGIERFRDGQPVNDDMEARLAELLRNKDIEVSIILGKGPGSYDMLSSDLGHEYVTLNSDYRS